MHSCKQQNWFCVITYQSLITLKGSEVIVAVRSDANSNQSHMGWAPHQNPVSHFLSPNFYGEGRGGTKCNG